MRDFNNQIFTKTIPAGVGQYVEFFIGGTLCVIRDATAPFDIEFDDWGKADCDGGYDIDTGRDRFRRVRVYNKDPNDALTVSLAIGTGSGTPGVRYEKGNRVPGTVCKTSLNWVSIADEVEFKGVRSNRRRKSFTVTMRTTSGIVAILNDGVEGASVGTSDNRHPASFREESDANFTVKNTGAVPASFTTMEIFYK